MMPSDFLQQHGAKHFRHCEELFSIIKSGNCLLSISPSTNLTCRHLLSIYRRRINHLQSYTTKHAISITEDLEALCDELKFSPNEFCRIWMFKISFRTYHVFESTSTHRIFGCVSAIDKREIDEITWKKFWQKGGRTDKTKYDERHKKGKAKITIQNDRP